MRHWLSVLVFCVLMTDAKPSYATEHFFVIETEGLGDLTLTEDPIAPVLAVGVFVAMSAWGYLFANEEILDVVENPDAVEDPDDEDICSICLETIQDEDDGLEFHCGHRSVHYGKCLKDYLEKWLVCPRCQK